MLRRARRAAAVLAAAAALTLGVALPASAEPNYPPAFTRISADRTIVAPRTAVHFSAQTFTPGSTVAIDVTGSSAQSLTAPVNADGVAHAALSFDFVGAQTVTFRGVDLLGAPLALSTVITVVPAGSPGTGGPGTTGGGSTTGGSGATGSGTTGSTGTDGSGTAVGSGSGGSNGSGTGATTSGTGTAPNGAGSTGGSGTGSLDASGSATGDAAVTAVGGTLGPAITVVLLGGLLLASGVALIVAGRRRNRSADA
jgi:hypothetical protein